MRRPIPRAPTTAWRNFNAVSFAVAATMMAGGIWYLEASFSAKGFYAMAALMLVHTAVSLTKTMRDVEETQREAEDAAGGEHPVRLPTTTTP